MLAFLYISEGGEWGAMHACDAGARHRVSEMVSVAGKSAGRQSRSAGRCPPGTQLSLPLSAGVIGMCHHAWLFKCRFWIEFMSSFLQGWFFTH